MSAGGQFGGARGLQAKAPEKGVFPLDHFGECQKFKDSYLACLKEHGSIASECVELTKAYLDCRMQRGLMAPQDLKHLGLDDEQLAKPQPPARRDDRAKKGFVAGVQ